MGLMMSIHHNRTLSSGTWFSRYASHIPTYWVDAGFIKVDSRPPVGGTFQNMVTKITTTGICMKMNITYTLDPDNAALASAAYHDGTVRKVNYPATDYTSTLAVYREVYRAEKRVPKLSFLSIMTREPNMEVNHTAIDEALETFCGKGATDLERFFDRLVQDANAVCKNPIYVNVTAYQAV